MGEAFVPFVGGDRIGPRPVDFHITCLRAMGAEVEATPDGLEAKATRLHGARIRLPFPSVGATETVLLTAALMPLLLLAGWRDTDTPDRELARQQMEQTVMRAVDALPEELRTAITLREVEGLSYEEIATRMDCPIGTVRSRIFRAREAIDVELEPLMDTGSAPERAAR